MAGSKKGEPKQRKLNEDQKAYVVRRLAVFTGVSQICAEVKQHFGIDITPGAIEAYNPHRRAGAREGLAQKWIDLFNETRKDYTQHAEKYIPLANKSVRIEKLQEMYDKASAKGNLVVAAKMLEQLSKELGDVYTIKREITGKDGGPIAFSEMTDEQLDARLATLLTAIGGSNATGDQND